MKKILFFICVFCFNISFSQYSDFLSYDANRNSDKWTYLVSKQQTGNVFDGINEEVIRHAKICNENQDCLKLRQENDGEIYYSLDEALYILGVSPNLDNRIPESNVFLLVYTERVESFNQEKEKFDNTDTSLRLEIAFNDDPDTIEKFEDISPNTNRGTLSMNKYFSDDNSKDIQVSVRQRIYNIPSEELDLFIKKYPMAKVVKPLSNFFNLLKSNSSIQIKMSGMGSQKVMSFSLKGSSKALSIFNK
tara:strand:- start:3329 stop:4072 length:744 start_codon:yes stop_codon:yes gene_type:complete